MKLDHLNPFVRYAGVHSYYEPPRTNNRCYDCRLFYISKGDGSLFVGNTEHTVEENTAIFLPPRSCYRFSFRECGDVKIYVLDIDLVDEYSALDKSLKTALEEDYLPEKSPEYMVFKPFRSPIVLYNAVSIFEYIRQCIDLFLHREPYFRESASANVKLALLAMLAGGGCARGRTLSDEIIDFVRSNYSRAELSNKVIAERLGYHPYYLSRVIKSATGATLGEYVLSYRIQMAENYLITTSESVTSIAEMCGFASYTYFIKVFRERVGRSPLQYRKSHRLIGL